MVLTGLIAKHFYGITYIIGGMERSSKLYREAYENVKRECAAEDGTIQEGIGPLPIVGSGIDQPDHITSLGLLFAVSRRNMEPYRQQVLMVLVASAEQSGGHGAEVKLKVGRVRWCLDPMDDNLPPVLLHSVSINLSMDGSKTSTKSR